MSFVVTVDVDATGFLCIGAIVTFGAQAPVPTISDGKADIVAADSTPRNLQAKMGWKIVSILSYNPALGNIVMDMHFTTFDAFTVDAGGIGGMDPNNTVFPAVGAGNCVFLSDGVYTVDDGLGNIQVRSDQDHLWYTAHIDYATGNVTFIIPPPDGSMLYRPTA